MHRLRLDGPKPHATSVLSWGNGGRPWNRTRHGSPRRSYSPLPHLAARRPMHLRTWAGARAGGYWCPLGPSTANEVWAFRRPANVAGPDQRGRAAMKKPKWVIEKERDRRAAGHETLWLFGLHAVADALRNPRREKLRLVVTRNALQKLGDAVGGIEPEIADARKFPAPLERDAVHQG